MEFALKDVFLCHTGADKDWTRKLGERIEKEEWGGRRLSVFFDEWDIEPGDNILLKLNEGLAKSRFVALVMSPEMVRADWPSLELTAILASDPMNRQGRLIPLLLRDADKDAKARIDIPPVLRPFLYIDFRDPKEFERGFARLVAKVRAEAPPRGTGNPARGTPSRSEPAVLATFAEARQEPDKVHDTLISNLLPVVDMPKVLWSAPTTLKSKGDLPKGNDLPPFILREGRIYTFSDLSDSSSPLRAHVTEALWQRHAVTDWRNDIDRWRWVIELLNVSLKQHLWTLRIAFDRDTRRYFFKLRKLGKSVRLKWGSGTRRTVVRAPDPEKGGNYVHQGARLSFESLGDRLFLSVEPCWVFTRDGANSIRRQDVGPLAMQWGGKERNGAIIRHVLMWSDVLTNGRRTGQVPTGDKPIVLSRLPATVGIGIGIADDVVAIKALLRFTKAEQDLEAPEQVVLEYLEDEADASDAPENEE